MTRAAAVVGLALAMATCAPRPNLPSCARYEGPPLVPANGFASFVSPTDELLLDGGREYIDLALTVVRPVQGTPELVHVIGDREVGRWPLVLPAGQAATIKCKIGFNARTSSCRAVIRNPPHSGGGYYHLRANGVRVLEAGLAFYLCESAPHSR